MNADSAADAVGISDAPLNQNELRATMEEAFGALAMVGLGPFWQLSPEEAQRGAQVMAKMRNQPIPAPMRIALRFVFSDILPWFQLLGWGYNTVRPRVEATREYFALRMMERERMVRAAASAARTMGVDAAFAPPVDVFGPEPPGEPFVRQPDSAAYTGAQDAGRAATPDEVQAETERYANAFRAALQSMG